MNKADRQDISISFQGLALKGLLGIPEGAKSIIVFAHGSGSSRLSKRNNFVAQELRDAGMATLLFDLLTEEEDQEYDNRFDIPRLSERLVTVTTWVQKHKETKEMTIGYFGASTGAAAALEAAAKLGDVIKVVVSRGGRPDLALDSLNKVDSPTLLIVGGNDDVVIELNQKAFDTLACEKDLQIVPGATHLFEEPGTLEQVAELAKEWFMGHLAS